MLANAAHDGGGPGGHTLVFSQSVIKYNLNIIIPNVQRAIKSHRRKFLVESLKNIEWNEKA